MVVLLRGSLNWGAQMTKDFVEGGGGGCGGVELCVWAPSSHKKLKNSNSPFCQAQNS